MDFLKSQLKTFQDFLRAGPYPADGEVFKDAQGFIDNFPGELTEKEERDLRILFNKAFGLLEKEDENKQTTQPFDVLLPPRGWLHDYYLYTLASEPPTVFHFAASITVLGAALGRNVFFDKGFYHVYPNIATVLIAPTGKCRKTSATNVALGLARDVGVTVLSDKITPEALVMGLGGKDEALGLMYAPELAVFLGRQKYLEGMVPLLTSLFDAPEVWSSTTIGRGELSLKHVALCMLGASTMEWFVEALPREAFSGGFMSRILFIVQEETDRVHAIPKRPEGHLFEALRERLAELRQLKGEVTLSPEALKWYTDWYKVHHHTPLVDSKMAGYHERKPDHLLRLSYIIRISIDEGLILLPSDLERGLAILDWLELQLPKAFAEASSSPQGSLHQRILHMIDEMGGQVSHSILLRRHQHLVNARSFREAIETLKESACIEEVRNAREHYYIILPGGKT